MSMLGLGLGAGASLFGSLLGGFGNASAARAQNNAGQAALARYTSETDLSRIIPAWLAMGGNATDLLRGTIGNQRVDAALGMSQQDRSALQSQLAGLENQLAQAQAGARRRGGDSMGGGILGRAMGGGTAGAGGGDVAALQSQIQQIRSRLQQGAGQVDRGAYDSLINSESPITQMENLGREYQNRGDATMRGFDAETSRLSRLVNNYGSSETSRINREADRAIQTGQRAAQNRLAASGTALSSLATPTMTGIARDINESRNDQVGRINDAGIDRRLNIEGGRANQRTALSLGLDDRNVALRTAPINSRLAALTGPGMSPFLGQSMTPYFPGASPGGAAAQTFGNSLSALGGLAMGYGATAPSSSGGYVDPRAMTTLGRYSQGMPMWLAAATAGRV